MHMVMWIMSDRAIPRSFRFMEGFGVHTFRLVNAEGKSTFVKFHWKPKLGMQSVVWNEAVKINGADPDFHRRDLWNAIQAGDFPEWELGLQLFDENSRSKFAFDVLDATKLIPEEQVPMRIRSGGSCSTAASTTSSPKPNRSRSARRTSCPASTSPTIRCCRGATSRISTRKSSGSAGRTSRYLPINAPKCPFHTLQQDGHMAYVNPKGRANYEPNSWTATAARASRPSAASSRTRRRNRAESCAPAPKPSPTTTARRANSISAKPNRTGHIAAAFTFELSKVETPAIRARMVSHLLNVDENSRRVWPRGWGWRNYRRPPPRRVSRSPISRLLPALSILANPPMSFAGRKLGMVVSAGAGAELLADLQAAAKDAKADCGVDRGDGRFHRPRRETDRWDKAIGGMSLRSCTMPSQSWVT